MNKFIKSFETFSIDKIKDLINNKETYLRKKSRIGTILDIDIPKYNLLKNKLINYDIRKFDYKQFPYGIYITPDNDFLNLIKEINEIIENKIPLNIEFDFSIDENRLNLIDFEKGIPEQLRGYKIGYKLYKMIITKFGFVTSNKYSTMDAYNIWYNLMLDKDLYCFTSEIESGVIYKYLDNNKIKEILEKFKNKNIIFDDELTEKIKELYGTLDSYKK